MRNGNDMDCMTLYRRDIERIPLLTKSEECELGKRVAAGDATAVEALANANLRLVVSLAKAKASFLTGIALEDLLQEGNIGLFKAAQKFDVSRGFRFSTYAVHYINKHMLECIRKQSHRVVIPEHTYRILVLIRNVRDEMLNRDGNVTLALLSEKTGIGEKKLKQYMEYLHLHEEESYDKPVSDDDSSTILELYKSTVGLPEVDAMLNRLRDDINEILDMYLDTEEKMIVRLRYNEEMTYEMIGINIGCSGEKVGRRLKRIQKKLKPVLKERKLDDYLYVA